MDIIVQSDELVKFIKEKAKEFNTSENNVLEAMIKEFMPSTKEDIEKLQEARRDALLEFLNNEKPINIGMATKAWTNGYNAGWYMYQLRKKDTMINFIRLVTGKGAATLDQTRNFYKRKGVMESYIFDDSDKGD